MEKVVNGVTYVAEASSLTCRGCAAAYDTNLCDALHGNPCLHIWTKKPEEQPIKVYSTNPDFIEKIQKQMYSNTNPIIPCERPPVPPAPSKPIQGVKTDTGKPRYGLIPPFALEQVAICLTEGLKTHPAKDNWKLVEDGKARFLESLERHFQQYKMGEVFDRDNSNVRNLAAVIVNALFALEFEVNPELKGEEC